MVKLLPRDFSIPSSLHLPPPTQVFPPNTHPSTMHFPSALVLITTLAASATALNMFVILSLPFATTWPSPFLLHPHLPISAAH